MNHQFLCLIKKLHFQLECCLSFFTQKCNLTKEEIMKTFSLNRYLFKNRKTGNDLVTNRCRFFENRCLLVAV